MATVTIDDKYKFRGTTDAVSVATREYDFAANPASSADVIELIHVPQGVWIQEVIFECVTAEGGVATGTIGIATDDPDGFHTAADLNDAAGPILGDGAWAAQTTGGFITLAEETIDIVLGANVDAAKIKVTAVLVHL